MPLLWHDIIKFIAVGGLIMFGIDWDLDGDVDIIDDLITLELLSEYDEEDDDR